MAYAHCGDTATAVLLSSKREGARCQTCGLEHVVAPLVDSQVVVG